MFLIKQYNRLCFNELAVKNLMVESTSNLDTLTS